MNILHKLLGKWEEESQSVGTVTYGSIFCKDLEESVLLVLEKHTRTGKKRAYIKDIHGNKTKIDVDYLKEMSK
jgi:hypothetical protein